MAGESRVRFDFSFRMVVMRFRGLGVICVIGVLTPIALLLALQYRSLQQLRAKTRLASENDIRQALDIFQHSLEARVRAIGWDSLASFSINNFRGSRTDSIGETFRSISGRHTEIEHEFAFTDCACAKDTFAVLSTPDGPGFMRYSRLDQPVVANALKALWPARSLSTETRAGDLIFFQRAASGAPSTLYIFRLLAGSSKPGAGAVYVGLELNSSKLVKEIAQDVLAKEQRRAKSELALAVDERDFGTVYASAMATGQKFSIPAGPEFPRWTLSGALRGVTIESLAQDQFRNGLLLSGGVFGCLIFAIVLSFRAIAREAKLAEVKAAFVSNVSHEMKTPLSLISLYAETLELGRVSEQKLNEYYRVIHNQARRLAQLMNRVLDFAAMEAGRKQFHFAPGDPAALVERVMESYRDHLQASGFTVAIDIQQRLPCISMDADAISQAFLNLLDNAIKYSGESKKLSVRVFVRGAAIAIEVIDYGIGIPRSEQELIFEKFYRVNHGLEHDVKGSGLGLSLAKQMVAAHGGDIQVLSDPGLGSQFTILLPIRIQKGQQAIEEVRGEQIGETAHR